MTTQTLDTITRAMDFAAGESEITSEALDQAYREIRAAWENTNKQAAALALLDSPSPGLRVEGEGWVAVYCDGFVPETPFEYWSLYSEPEPGRKCESDFRSFIYMPFLKQAVKGGAKVVSPVSVPAQEGK